MKITWRRVQDGYRKVGAFERAIVAKRVTYLAGLGIILGELVRDGIIPSGVSDGITHWATVGFSVAGVVGGVLWAHNGATPADPQLRPKDKYGNPLVSALDVGPHDGRGETDGLMPVDDGADGPTAYAALAAAAAVNPQPVQPVQPDPFMEGGAIQAQPDAAAAATVNTALTTDPPSAMGAGTDTETTSGS